MVNTEINKDSLSGLSKLSDEALREKLIEAAALCGIDKNTASARLPDVSVIKKKLASLSDRDVKRLVSALGEENVRKITGSFGDGSKQ